MDSYYPALSAATLTEDAFKGDGTTYQKRYQEMTPGQVMYGSTGEKPHPIH